MQLAWGTMWLFAIVAYSQKGFNWHAWFNRNWATRALLFFYSYINWRSVLATHLTHPRHDELHVHVQVLRGCGGRVGQNCHLQGPSKGIQPQHRQQVQHHTHGRHGPIDSRGGNCAERRVIIMENIESSWNILMDINFKILQSKYFNYKFSTYIL